jgi:hypothetical protein
MDKAMNTTNQYTFPLDSAPVVVPVAEFRNAIEHLERKVNVDYHACQGKAELESWVWEARRAGSRLIGMTCKRASKDDWMRRERIIDKSAHLLNTLAG